MKQCTVNTSINSIDNIVDLVFSKYPKPPCTYYLTLPEYQITQSQIFKMLMDVLISGAKKLYGDSIRPTDISEKQFDTLKMYIESLGYSLKYDYKQIINKNVEFIIPPTVINIWFEPYNKKYDCHGRNIF